MPGVQATITGIICAFCSEILTEEDTENSNWQYVCEDCSDNHIGFCERCDYVSVIQGSYLPTHVQRARENYGRAYVDRLFYREQIAYYDDAGMHLCSDCTWMCERCDTVYGYEENMLECCEEDEPSLHNYSWTPQFQFHTEIGSRLIPIPGRLYMGFEVEMEKASNLAKEACDKFGESWWDPSILYFKADGSLNWDGAEMVTQPMTLEAFRNEMLWDLVDWMRNNGARAWAYQRCGMHVHVSRTAFTPSHMWKFIKFQTSNSAMCTAIAGRESQQWASWSNDYMEEIASEPSKAVKKSIYGNRYSAININPRDTIELRYFRPNLTKNGLLRIAEFVDSIYEYTRTLTVADVLFDRLGFDRYRAWLDAKPQYETIRSYIDRINEEIV